MSRKVSVRSRSLPEAFSAAAESGRIFHAYLLEDTRGDAYDAAEAFAAAALCEKHDGRACGRCVFCRQIDDGISPYVIRIDTDESRSDDILAGKKKKRSASSGSSGSGKIKDSQIAELIERSRKSSLSGKRIFTIVEKADTITERGQNRLLKVLEEPPENMTFILIAENKEALLETIISRCQFVRTRNGAEDPADLADTFTKRAVSAAAAAVSGVPALELWKEIEYFSSDREKALRFADIAQVFYRDCIVGADESCRGMIILSSFRDEIISTGRKAGTDRLIQAAEACGTAVRDLRSMVGIKHALRYMLFSIQLGEQA